jgi:hypothetical protein
MATSCPSESTEERGSIPQLHYHYYCCYCRYYSEAFESINRLVIIILIIVVIIITTWLGERWSLSWGHLQRGSSAVQQSRGLVAGSPWAWLQSHAMSQSIVHAFLQQWIAFDCVFTVLHEQVVNPSPEVEAVSRETIDSNSCHMNVSDRRLARIALFRQHSYSNEWINWLIIDCLKQRGNVRTKDCAVGIECSNCCNEYLIKVYRSAVLSKARGPALITGGSGVVRCVPKSKFVWYLLRTMTRVYLPVWESEPHFDWTAHNVQGNSIEFGSTYVVEPDRW